MQTPLDEPGLHAGFAGNAFEVRGLDLVLGPEPESIAKSLGILAGGLEMAGDPAGEELGDITPRGQILVVGDGSEFPGQLLDAFRIAAELV